MTWLYLGGSEVTPIVFRDHPCWGLGYHLYGRAGTGSTTCKPRVFSSVLSLLVDTEYPPGRWGTGYPQFTGETQGKSPFHIVDLFGCWGSSPKILYVKHELCCWAITHLAPCFSWDWGPHPAVVPMGQCDAEDLRPQPANITLALSSNLVSFSSYFPFFSYFLGVCGYIWGCSGLTPA